MFRKKKKNQKGRPRGKQTNREKQTMRGVISKSKKREKEEKPLERKEPKTGTGAGGNKHHHPKLVRKRDVL